MCEEFFSDSLVTFGRRGVIAACSSVYTLKAHFPVRSSGLEQPYQIKFTKDIKRLVKCAMLNCNINRMAAVVCSLLRIPPKRLQKMVYKVEKMLPFPLKSKESF